MAVFEIPLEPARPQKFQIPLSGITYTMRLHWCEPQEAWLLDLGDANEAPLIDSIPLQPGADLLNQFKYLNIPGKLWVQVDGDPLAVPTFDNLGVNGRLYYEAP